MTWSTCPAWFCDPYLSGKKDQNSAGRKSLLLQLVRLLLRSFAKQVRCSLVPPAALSKAAGTSVTRAQDKDKAVGKKNDCEQEMAHHGRAADGCSEHRPTRAGGRPSGCIDTQKMYGIGL
jgi:hypothetical protein